MQALRDDEPHVLWVTLLQVLPAAITVLLLCLQLKEVTLGFALVLCFSIGLAITPVRWARLLP
jgi:ABC-type nickel/cobalt efflux system permease component RcnA